MVVRDLVAASYSHGDLGIDKGLVEERNIFNFFLALTRSLGRKQ